jgi:hypothetical protein
MLSALEQAAFCLSHPRAKLAYSNDVFSRLPLYTSRKDAGPGVFAHKSIGHEYALSIKRTRVDDAEDILKRERNIPREVVV